MDLVKVLSDIGLTDKEAKVYLALLTYNECLPSVVALKTGVKRPTVYVILEQLCKKGLAAKIKKNNIWYFKSSNPHNLVESSYEKFKKLENALPELQSLNSEFLKKPNVSFYEGKEGLISIMEDTLRTSTELLCWGNVNSIFNSVLADYYPEYIKKKVERKIWLRGIFNNDAEALELKKRGDTELREVYMVPSEDFPFRNEINIYDDKVAIVSHEDVMGVIIQNKNIADTQRAIFKFAFKYAKTAEKELLSKIKI